MLTAFSRYGVNERHITRYLDKSLDEVLPEDIADLQGVFNSLKSGQAGAGDFFAMGTTREARSVGNVLGNEERQQDQQQTEQPSAEGAFGGEQ